MRKATQITPETETTTEKRMQKPPRPKRTRRTTTLPKAELTEKPTTNQGKLLLLSLGALAIVIVAWSLMFDLNFSLKPSQRFLSLVRRPSPTPVLLAEATPQYLESVVLPQEGYSVNLKWGDVGKKLVEVGAIDLPKFSQNYTDPKYQPLLEYLTASQDKGITIDKDTAYFWVNTLWALGLVQKSDVLENGIMGTQYKDRLGNFASTAGWTLGKIDAVTLYSSASLIPLTADQEQQVAKITQGIYRPCCGNPASFPDCNHGMAILGLVELMVSQGFSEAEIYQAALAFNSYWFPQTYIDLAYYFHTKENTPWQDVDPQRVLSAQFSSGQGYQTIKRQIGNIPGLPSSGGSCGA